MKTLSANNEFIIEREGPTIYVNQKRFMFFADTQYAEHTTAVLHKGAPTYIKGKGLGFVIPVPLVGIMRKANIGSIIAQELRGGIMYKYLIAQEEHPIVAIHERHYVFVPIIKFVVKELKSPIKVPSRRRKKKISYKQGVPT